MDLLTILKTPEGKTLEFKRDLSSPQGILRTIVAFANTAGGIIIIGVEDKTRSICGVEDPLNLEERIANLINDSIQPRLIPEIEILPWRNNQVIAIQIHPSYVRPHYFKSTGIEKGTYLRVGSTNRLADERLIEELKRFSQNQPYDEQPMPELNSEAIDFRAASESFAPIRKLASSDLETLRLVTKYQGKKVPTVAGILLFGKDRSHYFPDAWIQLGRFNGIDKQHIMDTLEIHSYFTFAVDEAMDFVKKHAMRTLKIDETRHAEQWSSPLIAVREAIINAIVHADYSQHGSPIRISIFDDRLEIENPGLLPFGLTMDDLWQGVSKLRNRTIGRVFNALGFIERWGSGIQRMAAACREGGFADPQLQEIGTHFRVTIFTERKTSPLLDELDRKILQGLQKGKGLSTNEIAKIINRSTRATRTRLLSLIECGLVVELGSSAKDPGRKYFKMEKNV